MEKEAENEEIVREKGDKEESIGKRCANSIIGKEVAARVGVEGTMT